jgi:hypothetical protein
MAGKLKIMKNVVFWDVGPCKFCVNRRFGRTYRLHLQGRKIRERGTSLSRWLSYKFKIRFTFAYIYMGIDSVGRVINICLISGE